MLVTGVAGVVYTVTRGIESTSASSHAAGTAVVAVLTAGALDELRAEIEAEDRTASGIRTATTVVAVSSATAPTAGQVITATSGTAANWQTIPTPPTITDHGGAAAGDVVRRVSEGVLAKAQADSVPHATYVIGIWDGIQVIPFSSQPIVTFDSAPANGPCYLSSTLAGALTSTPPALGAVAIPTDLVVLQDYSIGSTYRARVGHSSSDTLILGRESDFVRTSVQATGMLPSTMRVAYDGFDKLGTSNVATWGTNGWSGVVGGPASCVRANACDVYVTVLKDLTISAQKWYFAIRFTQYQLTTGFSIGLARFEDATHGYETCGVHMFQVAGIWKFVLGHQNPAGLSYSIWTQSPPDASYYDILQTEDTNQHLLQMWCAGDGMVRYKWDGSPTVSFAQADGGHVGIPHLRIDGSRIDFDDFFFSWGD